MSTGYIGQVHIIDCRGDFSTFRGLLCRCQHDNVLNHTYERTDSKTLHPFFFVLKISIACQEELAYMNCMLCLDE